MLTFTGTVTNNIPIGTNVITNAPPSAAQRWTATPATTPEPRCCRQRMARLLPQQDCPPAAIPTQPGNQIEYTLRYGNAGNSFAENTIITDTLPANTTFVAASSPYTLDAGGTITWPIGTVSTGFSSVVTFHGADRRPDHGGMRQITNTAFITAPI